jgi:hypothetical protein
VSVRIIMQTLWHVAAMIASWRIEREVGRLLRTRLRTLGQGSDVCGADTHAGDTPARKPCVGMMSVDVAEAPLVAWMYVGCLGSSGTVCLEEGKRNIVDRVNSPLRMRAGEKQNE